MVLGQRVAANQLHDLGQAVFLLEDVTAARAKLAVVGVVSVEEGLEHTHVPRGGIVRRNSNGGWVREGIVSVDKKG